MRSKVSKVHVSGGCVFLMSSHSSPACKCQSLHASSLYGTSASLQTSKTSHYQAGPAALGKLLGGVCEPSQPGLQLLYSSISNSSAGLCLMTGERAPSLAL